jgi:hypothetical protein
MSSKIYDITYKKLVIMLLPTMLRRPLLVAFANAMVSPVVNLYRNFMQYRDETNYRVYHNGQICYLRSVLNDAFDPISRRIAISDIDASNTAVFIYERLENKFKMLKKRGEGAIPISRRGFSGSKSFNFMVNIPIELQGLDELRLKAIINIYKLASKRYAINYV